MVHLFMNLLKMELFLVACRIYDIFKLDKVVDNIKTIRNNNIVRQYNIQKISK